MNVPNPLVLLAPRPAGRTTDVRSRARCRRRFGALLLAPALAGCEGRQSAFATFGEEAAATLTLTAVMTAGAVLILAALLFLMWHASRAPEGSLGLRGGNIFIISAGAIFPTVVLLTLLGFSLPAMRPLPADAGALRIVVTGEQFWWRVRYEPPGAPPFETANQVRVPVGRPVVLELRGGDVLHSFWIPGLGGKMDMIPGRANRLVVRATEPGRFRGQCTEFCGLSHALMAFEVEALPPAAFARWMAAERAPAPVAAVPGRALFQRHGCGGCHRIAGHGAAGTIGPDLTHFAGRKTLGAMTLRQEPGRIAAFIRHPEAFKPGVRMPAYPQMSEAEARAIAGYLLELR